MSLGRIFSVWCDARSPRRSERCWSYVGKTAMSKEARVVARAAGWKGILGADTRRRDYCPKCAPLQLQEQP